MTTRLPRYELLIDRARWRYRWSLIAEHTVGGGIVADRAGWAWTYAAAIRRGRAAMKRDALSR